MSNYVELRSFRRPDYLLDALFKSLHKESVAWLKEIHFWAAMTRGNKMTDKIGKFVLPVFILAFYFGYAISGTFTKVLLILALLVLVIFSVRVLLFFVTRD